MEQPQTPEAKYNQVLLGSLLTTGGIVKREYGLLYCEKQPLKLIDYLRWKADHLGLDKARIIGSEDPVLLECRDEGILATMRDWFYWEGHYKRHIPSNLGATLGYLGLLVAYLDRGKILGPYHVGLRFVGFSREDLQRLVDVFNKTHSLSLYLSKENKSWHNGVMSRKIIIDKENLDVLLPVWIELLKKHKFPTTCLDKVHSLLREQPVDEDFTDKKDRCCVGCGKFKLLNEDNFLYIDKRRFGFRCRACIGSNPYNRKLSQSDLKEFLEKSVDKNNAQIAELLGMSRQRIHFLRRKFGIHSPNAVDVSLSREERDLLSAQRARFRYKKYNSRHRKVSFTLKFQDIYWPTHCPILGTELDYFSEKKQDNSPSFDRINPSMGYSKGNVLIISSKANTIKSNGTADEHRKIAEYIDKHDSNTVV